MELSIEMDGILLNARHPKQSLPRRVEKRRQPGRLYLIIALDFLIFQRPVDLVLSETRKPRIRLIVEQEGSYVSPLEESCRNLLEKLEKE
jgi:hypothetical protein